MESYSHQGTRRLYVCIDCGRESTRRTRCPRCERLAQAKRNALPKRAIYRDPAYQRAPREGICCRCGLPGADTRDHHPVSIAEGIERGWTIEQINAPSNLHPAHRHCNSAASVLRSSADCGLHRDAR